MQEPTVIDSPEKALPSPPKRTEAFLLTRSQINKFLKELEYTDHSEKTIETYRLNIGAFVHFLGTNQRITAQSLPSWRENLSERGYTPSSINSRISAVNSLYNFLGLRNWQVAVGKRIEPVPQGPELTRQEYLQLLQEAKDQENIQLYLLIKVLATTALTPSNIVLLTREAVNTGVVTGKKYGTNGPVILPAALQEELLEYARLLGLRSGPIFLNSERKSHERSAITRMITLLAADIGIEPGRANPRNLRRMYLNTMAQFQNQAQLWVNEQYIALLAEEEAQIGWRVHKHSE